MYKWLKNQDGLLDQSQCECVSGQLMDSDLPYGADAALSRSLKKKKTLSEKSLNQEYGASVRVYGAMCMNAQLLTFVTLYKHYSCIISSHYCI